MRSLPDSLAPFFRVCNDIANEISTADGFISVRALLERFRTTLRLRPLLVEGMIGSTSPADGRPPEWMVLVDSERYSGIETAIRDECISNPLPSRFRFTVAHELVHSLAFRMSEFGVTLEVVPGGDDDTAALVRTIEEQTDRLAPLLLCAEKFLTDRLRALSRPIDIDLLTTVRRECGLSREVLLNRLALSRDNDRSGVWQKPHLREFGIAIGEWNPGGLAILRRWPVFLSFGRTVPTGLLKLKERDRISFEAAFGPTGLFALPENVEVTVSSRAGTVASPDADEMTIEISAEHSTRAAGASFLALIRNIQVHANISNFEKMRLASRARTGR